LHLWGLVPGLADINPPISIGADAVTRDLLQIEVLRMSDWRVMRA
jgi:hypothetical protein